MELNKRTKVSCCASITCFSTATCTAVATLAEAISIDACAIPVVMSVAFTPYNFSDFLHHILYLICKYKKARERLKIQNSHGAPFYLIHTHPKILISKLIFFHIGL